MGNTMNDAADFLRTYFHPYVVPRIKPRDPVTEALFSRLTEQDVAQAEKAAEEEQQAHLDNPKLRAATILRLATHHVPHTREKTKLSARVPPDDIHRMQKSNPMWCGDFYSANMLGQAVDEAGAKISSGGDYLDFGCSSGSLVRVMSAAYPDASWSGMDPVESSVRWARENLANASFQVSPQEPPLDVPDASFDGVSAISIWSHFSEPAALRWFDEMRRIIRPGGWLMFTSHGYASLQHMLKHRHRKPGKVKEILDVMIDKGFAFEPLSPRNNLDMSNWGNSYFSPEWAARNITGWTPLLFQPGRNQSNQDVYLLRRS